MKEFYALDEFSRLFRYWWLIAICMLLGGVAAFLFHKANPPLYEATATIMATIDLQTFPLQDVGKISSNIMRTWLWEPSKVRCAPLR